MKTTDEKKQIMYESDEAASVQTITGWVSSTGRYWGKDEHMARYDGSTHKKCKCGEIISTHYIQCEKCHGEKWNKTYEDYPFKEIVFPVYDNRSDQYFFDEDQLLEYLEEEEISTEHLQLQLCEENHLSYIESDYWADILSEDGELPKNVQAALDTLNKAIKESGPVSYSPKKVRTRYIPNT